MGSFSGLFVVVLFGVGGFFLVSAIWDAVTKKNAVGSESAEPDELYARALGVRADAGVAELEHALERAILQYGPEHVAHMRPEDQQLSAIRLAQVHRAFDYLMAKRNASFRPT